MMIVLLFWVKMAIIKKLKNNPNLLRAKMILQMEALGYDTY